MKAKLLFALILLTSSLVFVGDTDLFGQKIAENKSVDHSLILADAGSESEDQKNKSCSCSCTSQGVLLQKCGDITTNLGDYGNKKKCKKEKKTHPGCN